MKNKWLAAALNFIPGLGYLYVGNRIPFAVLLLAMWPLLFISGLTMSAEELAASSEVTYRVWDYLPFLAPSAGFIVDGYFDAQQANAKQGKK